MGPLDGGPLDDRLLFLFGYRGSTGGREEQRCEEGRAGVGVEALHPRPNTCQPTAAVRILHSDCSCRPWLHLHPRPEPASHEGLFCGPNAQIRETSQRVATTAAVPNWSPCVPPETQSQDTSSCKKSQLGWHVESRGTHEF